jgi:hypothetical protein
LARPLSSVNSVSQAAVATPGGRAPETSETGEKSEKTRPDPERGDAMTDKTATVTDETATAGSEPIEGSSGESVGMMLDPEWSKAVALFAADEPANAPAISERGWRTGAAPVELAEFLAASPHEFSRQWSHSTDLESPPGVSVGFESKTEVWVSDSGRALLQLDEHWQAGTFLRLEVFHSLEKLTAELRRLAAAGRWCMARREAQSPH